MAFAHGKLILLGEHSVVYGGPAIAAGLSSGAIAIAKASETATLTLGDLQVSIGEDSDRARAFEALLGALESGPSAVEVRLALPPGAGLGASAAIGVATARAILEQKGEPPERDRILKAAWAWERVFHGNPSGIDAAAAALGGCFWYSRDEGPVPIRVFRSLPLAIALTGPAPSTKTMVEGVRRLREERPEQVNQTLRQIGELVERAKSRIESGDLTGVGELMDRNQALLGGLGVSTAGIERACELARAAGALGAKLTGGGGGGAVVALCEPDPQPVLEAWRTSGFSCFSAEVTAARGQG